MMNLSSLAPLLSALFAALGLVLPGILKRDSFSARINQAIAFSVVLLASIALAAVQSKFGPDFFQDIAIVMTGIHVLLGVDGPFKEFDQFLQSNILAGPKPAPLEQFGWIPQAPYMDEITAKQAVVHPQELPAVPKQMTPTQPIGG